MHLHEHQTATDRLYRDAERRLRWQTWAPILHAAWVLGLALACVLAFAYNGCGDMRDAHAEPVPTMAETEAHPAASQETPADPEVTALAARMARWQPLSPAPLGDVARTVMRACRRDPYPTPERCPELMAALAFRESSWLANAIGARGEVGAWQLLGAALAGETREAAFDLDRNAELALRWLRTADAMCRRAGWGSRSDFEARVLGAYGSGSCGASRGAALVLRWEIALRNAGGEP